MDSKTEERINIGIQLLITSLACYCSHYVPSSPALGSILEPSQAVASHLQQDLIVKVDGLVVEGAISECGPVPCSHRPDPGPQLIPSCGSCAVGLLQDNSSVNVLRLSRGHNLGGKNEHAGQVQLSHVQPAKRGKNLGVAPAS